MKLSFTTFACPNWPLVQVTEAANQYGYQGVGFRCDAGHRHGVEITAPNSQRMHFREQLEQAGIAACFIGLSLKLVADDFLVQLPA